MVEKRINFTMTIMSLIGGIIGFIFGEIFINAFKYKMSGSLLMGFYFGIVAFCIGLMCLIAEMINPKLNGFTWKNNYFKTSLKFLIPCTFIAIFVFGTLFQFIYESSGLKFQKVNDIVFVIDTSGSMLNTDPNNERFSAALNLINDMDDKNRISIYKFDDSAKQILPMTQVTQGLKKDAAEKLKDYEKPSGNTNMRDALDSAYDEINATKKSGRKAMVILLSDGEDNFDLNNKFDETMKPFKNSKTPVYTIGMSNESNFENLKNIAKATYGEYYSVKNAADLKGTFSKIYYQSQQRLLVDRRDGLTQNSSFYMVLRVLLLTLLGGLITTAVSFVFDNKNLLKRFLVGGTLAGLVGGIIVEFGFLHSPDHGGVYRFILIILISLIYTLIPVMVDVKDYSKSSYITRKSKVNGGPDITKGSRFK